jgi:hypothetical protein
MGPPPLHSDGALSIQNVDNRAFDIRFAVPLVALHSRHHLRSFWHVQQFEHRPHLPWSGCFTSLWHLGQRLMTGSSLLGEPLKARRPQTT